MRGYNFPAAVYLREIHIQCMNLRASLRTIEEWAPTWPHRTKRSIGEIIASLYLAFSSIAMISKLLFNDYENPTRPKDIRANVRRQRLRQLVNVSAADFSILSSAAVRNNAEHLDERLDWFFREFEGVGRYSDIIHIGSKPTAQEYFVGRWIDPERLTCGSLNDEVDVAACLAEVASLDEKVSGAFRVLETEAFLLWCAP